MIVWATNAKGQRVQVGEGVADEDGQWSITTRELGLDGAYKLTVTAVNAAGAISPESSTFEVVLDTVAPDAVKATLMDDQGNVKGEITSGSVTDDTSPTLKGTGEPGATVSVYLDGGSEPAGSVKVDAKGNWSLELSNLEDGEHHYSTTITDAAGNETQSKGTMFTVDSSKVVLTVSHIIDNEGSITGKLNNFGQTDDNSPELQGTALPGAMVTVRDMFNKLLGQVQANDEGVWSLQLNGLPDGFHHWVVTTTNAAGNTARATFTLNVDTTPPDEPIISSMEDNVGTLQYISQGHGSVTDDTRPTFGGKADLGSIITVYDGDKVLGQAIAGWGGVWSFTPTTKLAEGTHNITVTATDAVGNVSERSDAWSFIVDTTAPNVGISGNSTEYLNGMSEPGSTVTVIDAQGNAHSTVVDNAGRWVIAPNPLSVGESGKIYVTDPAGNKSDSVSFQGSALSGYDLLNESVQVNTTAEGDQANPTTTRLADGRIVVIWQGTGPSASEVYMQLFEADGVHKIGFEQQVNQRTNNNQDSPQVVALSDGGFLVVYESYYGGLDNSGDGVVARRYGADGQAVTDEFLINTTTYGNQNRPGVMATLDGGYVVTWESQSKQIVQRTYGADDRPHSAEVVVATGNQMGAKGGPEMALFTDGDHRGMYITVWNAGSGPSDSKGTGVAGQVFAADGTPLGKNVQINTTVSGDQNFPDVIILADGSALVMWDSNESNNIDIRAARYQVDPQTGELSLVGKGDFVVNTYTAGKQYKPVGVALEDGGYVIFWGSEGGDGDGSAIYGQRFDSNDARVGREFLVNSVTAGNQGTGGESVDVTHILDATLMADGNIYIAWQSDNVDGNGVGIEAIVVDPNASYYSEHIVNTEVTGDQSHSAVVGLPNGGAVVVWESTKGDKSGMGIKGQLLDARGMPVGDEFLINTTTAGDQTLPQVVVMPDGNFRVVWSSDVSGKVNAIKEQLFTFERDSDGNITGAIKSGGEHDISTSKTTSLQNAPTITVLNDGGYMVVWEAAEGKVMKVFGRQYDADGNPVTGEIELGSTKLSSAVEYGTLCTVSTLENGQVVVTYPTVKTGHDVVFRIYDPATQTLSAESMANQTQENNQASPGLTALKNGNFIVTWDSNDNGGLDQSGYGVWGRLFNADGDPISNEFLINNATGGDQIRARVESRSDGSFVAVYVSGSDNAPGAGTFGIYAQYFDANGKKVGQEFRINQLTQGDQVDVDATFLENGQLYVTWTDKGVGDGNGSAIKGRMVDLNQTLGLTPDVDTANSDPTLIEYYPSTVISENTLPPNVGISMNTADKLGGQTEPGAKVTVTDLNGKVYTAIADENGSWSMEPNPLSVDQNAWISASDAEGNASKATFIRGAVLDGYDLLNESTQVNTTTVGDQSNPTTARLADGNIVVIWQGDGISSTEIYMQLFDADGVHKIGFEQQINQRTNSDQDSPQVVALADGGFLVVWESFKDGLEDGDGVMARHYGANGNAISDEFLVNVTTKGDQNQPAVMAKDDGGYVITWKNQGNSIVQRTFNGEDQPQTGEVVVAAGNQMGAQGGAEMALFTDDDHQGMYITVWNASKGPSDTEGTGVVGQVFDADGKPLGGNIQINTTTAGNQNYPDVITLADGSVLAIWDSGIANKGTDSDIRAVRYQVDPKTGELSLVGEGDFVVNTYTAGKQYKPVAVALKDGGYVIFWGSEGGDGDGSAIYGQRFDSDNGMVGREFLVNSVTAGNQGTGGESVDVTHILDATLMVDGNIYITWQSDNVDGKGVGIEAIVVDPNAGFYSEFAINTTTANNQLNSTVESLPGGYSVVVWESTNAQGKTVAIKGQLLDSKGMPVGEEFSIEQSASGVQARPDVAVLQDGSFVVSWSKQYNGSTNHIMGQHFTYHYDGEGNVNAVPDGDAIRFNYNFDLSSHQQAPLITALDDGGYMVVWQVANIGSSTIFGQTGSWNIYGRQYNAEGEAVTDELFIARTSLNSANSYPQIASVSQLEDGNVVVAYSSSGKGTDISFTTYDPQTHKTGSTQIVNQTLNNDQDSPEVMALANGNFIVTWDSSDSGGPDQSGKGVWGRLFDSAGNAISNEFLLNTSTVGDQVHADVASRADGSFVVVYASASDSAPGKGTFGIYAQYFDAEGQKVGQEIQINQLTYGDQVDVDATFLTGGQLFVTWTDKGVGDGSGSAIKGRLIDLNDTLGLNDDGNGVTHIDYQPAQFYLNGTDGDDALDGRGAVRVDAKDGDDTIFINSTNFASIDGGEGHDTLVWDSASDFELGSVSSKIEGIEAIHMGNGISQTLVIRANDILDMTKNNGDTEHKLYITGDTGSSDDEGAKDTVDIDKSVWSTSSKKEEDGVSYDVYVNNEDASISLMIQNGMNIL